MTTLDERPVTKRPATLSDTWRDRAACAGEDPDDFFALPTAIVEITEAKSICARCPVRRACLLEAIESGPSCAGVWGGSSELDRQRAYRRVTHAELPATAANRFAAVERLLAEQASS